MDISPLEIGITKNLSISPGNLHEATPNQMSKCHTPQDLSDIVHYVLDLELSTDPEHVHVNPG